MFEGLLKSRFFSKCKSNIKLTRTRIEMIKKKRNATEKYLRNDIADLLKNGLDINAYGRAEGLLVEQNRSTCYDLIDQYCEHILKHLQDMNKQRECPDECKEAVSCLMFAAARFADLPELRELRTLFSERYGKSVDFYVNKQFMEKLKSGLPSKEMKLQLLQEIAAESGLEWDSKALENELFNGSAYNKNFAKESDERNMNDAIQKKDRPGGEYEFKYVRDFNCEKKMDRPSHDEQNETTINEVPPSVKDIQVDTVGRTIMPKKPVSIRDVPKKEENDDKPLKYSSIPPPYTKSVGSTEQSDCDDAVEKHDEDDSVLEPKTLQKSVRTRNLKPPPVGSESDTHKEKAAEGQRILKFFDNGGCDERDEEETMMDKLLQYYSRKKGSRGKSKLDNPNRLSSLPAELTSSSSQMETPKRHTRASSFQPELLNANPHVHPKLPDYDDFVARLASLRGNRGD